VVLGAILFSCLGLALAACGSSTSATTTTTAAATTTTTQPGVSAAGISAAECAANKAAGPILFQTSFDYAAAASIADVVVAADNGYFKDMCLTVTLQSGFSTDNVALVSANKVQMSSLGSDSEVIAAVAKSANLEGVLTYGKTAISELITPGKSNYTSLKQLDGTTVGIKGALPYEVEAMMAKEGVDVTSLKQVQESYDPTVINQGRITALPVYKSNEIHTLESEGQKFHVWDPTAYGIAASYGVMIVNTGFATANPTAVEDFLRADLEGFVWGYAHQAQTVADCQARIDPKLYITPGDSAFRWKVEAGIVVSSTPAGQPIGGINFPLITREYAQDTQLNLVPAGVDIHKAFNPTFVNEIYSGTTLIWPTKFMTS